MRAIGTFNSRVAATYTWTAGSNSWSNVSRWNYNNYAPGHTIASPMTNGGTIDLGGVTQSVVNVGTAGSPIVGTIQNGSLAFTGTMYVNSGTINANLSNNGSSGRLWIGGNSGATVYLGGTNTSTYSDTNATIIGHPTTGAGPAGTVKLTSPHALNAAGQDTQVWSGTLDLNGQSASNPPRSHSAQAPAVRWSTAAAPPPRPRPHRQSATVQSSAVPAISRWAASSAAPLHQDRRRHADPLRPANTYTGGIIVNGGVLQITGDAQLGAVPASPTVNVTLNGGELFNNSVMATLAANRTFPWGQRRVFRAGSVGPPVFTVNGQITGVGGLGVVWDSGTVVLNGANNYEGATTIGTTGNTYYSNSRRQSHPATRQRQRPAGRPI